MRLSDVSDRYLTLRAQEGHSLYTLRAYRVQHHLLIRDIGNVEIDTIIFVEVEGTAWQARAKDAHDG